MNDIYTFDDYRDFLKKRFDALKKKNDKLSIEYLSKKIGCSSSFIKKIFSKKTHIGLSNLEKFTIPFELTANEEEYLLFLVLYSKGSIGELTKSRMKDIFSTTADVSTSASDYLTTLCLKLAKTLDRNPNADDLKKHLHELLLSDDQIQTACKRSETILTDAQASSLMPLAEA